MPTPFLRDMRAGSRLQSFLVSAIVSVLFLRLALGLLHYPQLGGARLHVAHMLWGGFFMLAAIVALLSFVAKEIQQLAAVVGGIGFGTFIDEVGKFVTRDNDYFYRPAVAMIYVIFIMVYLAIRAIQTVRSYSEREYLVNALVQMEDVARRDLDEHEAERLRVLLDRSDPEHPLVQVLRSSLSQASLVPLRAPSFFQRAASWIAARYRRLASSPRFPVLVMGVFIADLLMKMIATARMGSPSLVEWLRVGSWVLSAFFVARGVFLWGRSRLEAFRSFEVSVLVAIFITHVFSFYKDQLAALAGLSVSILLLISVRYMIRQERLRVSHAA